MNVQIDFQFGEDDAAYITAFLFSNIEVDLELTVCDKVEGQKEQWWKTEGLTAFGKPSLIHCIFFTSTVQLDFLHACTPSPILLHALLCTHASNGTIFCTPFSDNGAIFKFPSLYLPSRIWRCDWVSIPTSQETQTVFQPWVRIGIVSWQGNSEGISKYMMQPVFAAMLFLHPVLSDSDLPSQTRLEGQLGRHLRLDDATDVCSHAVLRSPFTVLSMGEGIESVCTICALTVGTFKMLKGCHAFTMYIMEHGKHQEPQQQHAKELQKYNKQGQGHFRPEATVKEKSSRICTKKHWLIFGDNVFFGYEEYFCISEANTPKQINKITRLTVHPKETIGYSVFQNEAIHRIKNVADRTHRNIQNTHNKRKNTKQNTHNKRKNTILPLKL
ncbi:hypothetical protein LXL04_029736 [Taraxacum kok-saghyz]